MKGIELKIQEIYTGPNHEVVTAIDQVSAKKRDNQLAVEKSEAINHNDILYRSPRPRAISPRHCLFAIIRY